MLLLLLQILLYPLTRKCLDMNIVVEHTWKGKEIYVGLFDSLVFSLNGESLADWNDGVSPVSTGAQYPPQTRINATKSFVLTCAFKTTPENFVVIKVQVLDHKEFATPLRTMVIEDEVVTFKNVSSCHVYSHENVVKQISNNVIDQIFYSSGVFRISKVSTSHLGIHKCDHHVIEIVDFKQIQKFNWVFHELFGWPQMRIYQEIEVALIPLRYGASSSALWTTPAIYRNLIRHTKDGGLIIEPNESTTEVLIFYIDGEIERPLTIIVERLTLAGKMIPSNQVILGNEVDFSCIDVYSTKLAYLNILHTLSDMENVLIQSMEKNITKRSKPSCKQNPCYFTCIHRCIYNAISYTFTTNIQYYIFRPIQVTQRATIIGMHGEGLAISIVGVDNHKDIKWCSNENQEILTPYSTETALMLILQYDMAGTLIYGIEHSGNCGPSNQRKLILYFMLSPLLSIDGMHNNTVRLMVDDNLKPAGAAQIFPGSDGRKFGYRLTEKSTTSIESNFFLFSDQNPPRYGYTRFQLVVSDENGDLSSPRELYDHSFLTIIYKKLDISSNEIIVFVGEYISICIPFLQSYDICELKSDEKYTDPPFENRNYIFLDKCLFMKIHLVESYVWKCLRWFNTNWTSSYEYRFRSVPAVEIKFSVEHRNNQPILRCSAVVNSQLNPLPTLTNTEIYPLEYANGMDKTETTGEYMVLPSILNSQMQMVCRVEITIPPENEQKRVVYKESTFTFYNHSHIFYIGQDEMEIKCHHSVDSPQQLKWSMGSSQREISEADGRMSYKLPDVTEPEKRIYTCTWTNEDNSNVFYVVHNVDIQASAVTMDISSNVTDTYLGGEVEIRCEIRKTLNSIKSARAILRKVTDSTCDQYDLDCANTEKDVSANDDSLIVLTLNLETLPLAQNNFECIFEIENSFFRKLHTLSVETAHSLSMLPVDEKIVTYLGAQQEIRCVAHSGTAVNIRIIGPDNQILTSVTGNSISITISIENTNQAGIYKCEIVDESDVVVIAKSRTLVVNPEPVTPVLQFTSSLVSEKASRYNSILFKCSITNVFATETGRLKITNKKEDCMKKNKCSEMNFDRSSPPISINITYSSDDEDSEYFCIVKTWTFNVEKSIRITYISKPRVAIEIIKPFEMKVGNPVNISCCVISEEQISVVINWKHRIGSVANLFPQIKSNCMIFKIQHLGREHVGTLFCEAQISDMTISNETQLRILDVWLNSTPENIPNGANIAISSELILPFEIYETVDTYIILRYDYRITDYSSCYKSSETKVHHVQRYLCSVKLKELGNRTLTLEDFDENRNVSHLLHTYRLTVVPRPTIVAFQEDIQHQIQSGGLITRSIICSATGFVTEIRILSMTNNERTILLIKVVDHSSTSYNFTATHQISYIIDDQDIPEGGIFKCEATSSISGGVWVANPIIEGKELKMEKNLSTKKNLVMEITLAVFFGVIVMIAAVWMLIKLRQNNN